MTAHTSPSSRSRRRRRRRGPTHASGRRGGRGRVGAGLVALAVLGAAGFAVAEWAPPMKNATGRTDTEAGPAADPGRTPTRTPSRTSPPSPTPTPTPTSKARSTQQAKPATTPTTSAIPATGPGTFVTAAGHSAKVGSGRTLRYRVEVETGLALSASDVAEQVERVLAHPRGWTAKGTSAFERVPGGSTDFVVRVATPGTVDEICRRWGLDTKGEYNCNVDDNVMVNLERWELATPVYAKDVPSYRALIINHEVGHFLGHGHVTCPGPGKPAPAMMQQIKGMHGCVPNVWPYDTEGSLITGPSVP
ncbi:DUF3152 domain-containing protein [Streptomyces sp. RG80]|uniref:DUF3152 domain-containing protein n=1 Tax=Streptomyces sp. RG80 TaxID=3157340 RepID=UPI00338FE2F5